MKVKNSWKRVVAGVLAVLVMAGAAPGGVDLGGIFGGSSIVAKADYVDGSLVVVNTSVTSTITNGDGWSFDADNNTLTLNGANITQCGEETGCGIYYGGSSPLSIVLVGDNTIDISSTNGDCGIFAMNSLIISGTGKLTVKGKSQGIAAYGVNFNGGTVDVEAKIFAVNGDEGITIGNATVTATATDTDMAHALVGAVKNSIAGKGWSNAEGTEDETAIEVSETGRSLMFYKKVQFTATAAVTEWAIGDNINLNGKWFFVDDMDTNTRFRGKNSSAVVPTPSYDESDSQWVFGNFISADQGSGSSSGNIMPMDSEVPLFIKKPSGKSSAVIPSGFKIKGGSGTQADPYSFELVYPTKTVSSNTPQVIKAGDDFKVDESVSAVKIGDESPSSINIASGTVFTVSEDTNGLSVAVNDNECTLPFSVGSAETYLVEVDQGTLKVTENKIYKSEVSVTDLHIGDVIAPGAVVNKGTDPDASHEYYLIVNEYFVALNEGNAEVRSDGIYSDHNYYISGVASDNKQLNSLTAPNNAYVYTQFDYEDEDGVFNYYYFAQTQIDLGPVVTTAPTAKENLKYNGEEQTLVTAGEAANGTMQYGLGEPIEVIEKGEFYELSGDDLTVGKIFKPSDYDGFNFPAGKKVKLLNNNVVTYPCDNDLEESINNQVNVFIYNDTTLRIYGDDAEGSTSFTDFPSGCDALRIDGINGDTIEVTAVKSSECLEVKTWSATPPKGTNAGEYTVFYKAVKDNKSSDVGSVTATIAKADPTVTTAPTAKENLKYNGELQDLITQGEATNGTMQYAIVEGNAQDEVEINEDTWSDVIPKGTDAGDYDVYYRVKGDANHKNTAPTKIENVKIARADPTVTAPTAKENLKYNGNEQELVTEGTTTGGTMQYAIVEGNAQDEVEINEDTWSDVIPKGTNAGDYNVYYRVKGDANHKDTAATKIENVKIARADPTVTTAPTAKENLKYNGELQDLITAGTSEEGTVQYAIVQDEGEIDEEAWSDVIPKGTDAGDYDVYYRVKGDANHKDTAPTKIENVKIARADPTVTTAPTAKENLKFNGELQDLITAGTSEDGTVQYAVVETDDDTPEYTLVKRDTDAPLELSDVKVNTIYTPDLEGDNQGNEGVRFSSSTNFKIDDITYTGSIGLFYNPDDSEYYLDTDKGYLPLPEGCDGLLVTDIDSGIIYAEFVNSANPVVEPQIDEEAWVEVIPKETDAGEYNVYYRVKGDANHNNTKPVKIENVKIAKADATVTAPTPLELTYTGKAQALVTEGTTTGGTMMYAVNTDSSTEPTSFTNDIPSETNAGTYYVWYTLDGEDNYNDTDPKCVPVTISKADPTVTAPTAKTLTYNGKAQALVTEGTTTAGTMQYALSASPVAQPKGEYSATVPTAEKAGPYYVWYKVVGDDNYNDAKPKCVTATIAKADPTVTAPTAKTLTYNGSAQALVTAGKTTGGTMQYALSASPVAKPKGEYSATVPTAEKAGPYYVWYKVVGDDNYNDAEPKCVTATIKKAVVTVTANNLSKKWGAKDPELTYKATGLVGKDKLTGALTREAGEKVGKYAIKQGTLAANENYTLKFNGAVLTINTAYFKITFVNDDGTVLQSSEVGNGAMPKYTGKTPTKPATAQYTYTFKGWNKTITAVTGAATYKATYNKAVNKAALNTAIKALDALNKTIKNDKQYAEIYEAANEAIAKAKSVADSKTATVEQVAEQTKLLNDMIDNFEAAKKLIRDLDAANKVAKMINELPEAKDVSKADKQAIEAARAGFKALTDFQKKIITQSILYQKLVDDEKALAAALKKVDTTRLSGSDRFATAAEISKASFTKADTVILTFGYSFADALAGVPLATKLNAPILLTEKDTLPKATLAEIKRLGAKKVIILGGTTAVSEKVEKALANKKLTTERIAGNTRFATATAIAEKLNKKPTDVFFVYGLNFADAMSVSTVAAIKNAPIIYLTKEGKLDADTAAYLAKLKKTGSVKNAYVIGGEAVISNDMASQAAKALGLKKATRVAGDNRFLTSVEVNKKFADVLKGDKICVATGMNFPDALAGGVYAAKNKAPLFLINGNEKTPNLLAEQKSFLKAKNSHDITIFGGTGAVSDNAVKAITDTITEKAKK